MSILNLFKRKTRKSTAGRRATTRRRAYTWRQRLPHLIKRWALRASILFLVLWIGLIAYTAGVHTSTSAWLTTQSHRLTAAMGFELKQIEVTGRRYTNPQTLRDLIQMEQGDSLFAINLQQARGRIQTLPWVRDVSLRRQWPDRISISLDERQPLALWQQDGKLSVIDLDGEVIYPENLDDFTTLPILTGQDAPEHARTLIEMLTAEPIVAEQVDSAIRIGGRRWDIKLKNGIKIKLPEDDMPYALARVAEAERKYLIFSKEILSLDARFSDKLIVKASSGAAERISAALQNDTISVSR
jgi:cell division protein FtsQ